MAGPGGFPAEEFLAHPLPDYPAEWAAITRRISLTVLVFVVGVPVLLSACFSEEVAEGGGEGAGTASPSPSPSPSPSSADRKRHRNRDSRSRPAGPPRNAPAAGAAGAAHAHAHAHARHGAGASPGERVINAPPLLVPLLNLLCLFLCLLHVANSPNNRVASRAVYVAPLLTPDECGIIVDMASRAAGRNVERAGDEAFLREVDGLDEDDDDDEEGGVSGGGKGRRDLLDFPEGWRKDRHEQYPTTDLNVVTDPFSGEDREWLAGILDARLVPLIERVYGIPPASIRANDMFVVRYDPGGDGGQPALGKHTDSSHVSFNVLLNDAFEGGGTRYHDRVKGEHVDVRPVPGEVLLNNACVHHEGLPTTAGTRYILVGFLNVDRKNPYTSEPTGLGLYASWLSMPWAQRALSDGIVASEGRVGSGSDLRASDSRYVVGLFEDLIPILQMLGDLWAPHTVSRLVDGSNLNRYLDAMRVAEDTNSLAARGQADWFQGQQIYIDFDGRFVTNWETKVEDHNIDL